MSLSGGTPRIEQVHVNDLIAYARNSRTHSDLQVKQIAASMREFGFTNPVLIAANNEIIAGHGRVLAAKSLKLKTVPCIRLEYLTDDQRRAYVIADNKLALNSGWDIQILKDELLGLKAISFDIELTGFTGIELDALLAPALEPVQGETDPDDVPEDAETRCQPGDVWVLGNHRVMCGDSTNIQHVETLMNDVNADMVFTDPPYGVSYKSNRAKEERFDVIQNDDEFLTEWVNVLPVVSSGWVFVWTSWKVFAEWQAITKPIGELTNVVVWDKGGGGIGDLTGTFSTDFEIALVFNRGAKLTGKRIGSVWSVGKDRASEYVHPTQKPVELGETAITHCTNQGASVLDLFLGSGSTLIACERTGRRCFGMELDPKYCDVILERWEKFTGRKAVLNDGETEGQGTSDVV